MSRNSSKKSALRFEAVSIESPFQVNGLGSLVLSTRFAKDQGTIHQLAAALGLSVETVNGGLKVVDGVGASIKPCQGHWHIVDNFDGSEVGMVEFAIREQDGWALQIARLSPLAQSRLEFIDGAEEVVAGTSLDDMIERGADALREEIFREEMLREEMGRDFGRNGSSGFGGNGGDVLFGDMIEQLRRRGIDVSILGV